VISNYDTLVLRIIDQVNTHLFSRRKNYLKNMEVWRRKMFTEELAQVVGGDNIIQLQSVLDEYCHNTGFVQPFKPSCVVRPKNAAEVVKIVNFANQNLIPLVPVSSGLPHRRGDTVPGAGGAIIVDMSQMKKIMRVDRIFRTALCEPGTPFGELTKAVNKEGLRLNMPLLPRKSKSVIGSMLEREPVTMPGYHWDISDPLTCVELVFGTGDVFRTGSAAGPGTLEEQWQANQGQNDSAGPSQFSLHRIIQGAQGTFGIVTWASLRCELLPKIEAPFFVGSSQINPIMEMVHWLIRLRLVNECFILNSTDIAKIMANKSSDEYQNAKNSLPPWVLFLNIVGYDYLPEKRVDVYTRDMKEVARRAGLEPVRVLGKFNAYEFLSLVNNPSPEPYWKDNGKGACEDIAFLTTYDSLSEFISIMQNTASDAGYPASDIGIYLQPAVQGTCCHCEFNLFFDPENSREVNIVRKLTGMATTKLLANGAHFSRPYGEMAQMIMNKDAATVAALKKIKTIYDPNNIMNPGKLCF
jgi:FAD/FMN-containing dehydrogenase